VTHITLSKKSPSKPSLEFYSDGNGEARRVTIEQFPFRIGRAETADLRVESVEVSREHAEIVERNGMWLIHDLNSTNGTQVNGKVITEALLSDGDIVRVAQTELTFIASSASQFQRMVTQPISVKKETKSTNSLPPEVAATRMLTEATLWQAIPARLYGVTSLRTGTTEAWFAPAGEDDDQRQLMELAQTVAERYRQIERLRVMELAIDRSEASRLFLGVGAAEIESPHRLFSSVKQIHSLLPHGWELGITISLPTDVDTLRITEIYRQAREEGLLVAYDEFQGNGGQVMHFESLVPDYLVLAANMIKDLQPTRQPIRRLESLITACDELLIKPVLPRTDCAQTLAQCRELGYDLVLQSPRKRTNSVLLRQGAAVSAAGVLV
jgi:hypothetical protein